jgi:polysaccharide export outer membrane protein
MLLFVGLSSLAAPSAAAQSMPTLPGPTYQPVPPSPSGQQAPVNTGTNIASLPAPTHIVDEDYKLGSGDKIKIVVYTEDDLGGEFLVDGSGQVQLPLLGQMQAAGLSIRDFEASIVAKFVAEDYLKNPRISVEVENYRPFYIIGEVKTPGQYPYISGMNALNAVALAGGYTYRADDSEIYLRRNGSTQEVRLPADQSTKIGPGDIIRIDERIF